ncbi:DedA family protein [Streptomyces galbus]|uniref:DedA family protein n=1 Tax=Streptomyces galbus TaxID=33898 RepID=A0A4U5X136_STRGB|nr:VTT domain-containing protein [Streptomyces galbus]TKT08052.1 DedA family protein [Streptomyces galbus]GHD42448.1 hypothetical protein GCM10010335_45380 [Streptomyces galbus]
MNVLTDILGQVTPEGAYALLAAAVLAESVLLIGAFIPTLTLLLTAGALARTGSLDLWTLVTTAACAVVVGDFLAHRTGRVLGSRLRTGRLGRRIPATAWRRTDTLTAHQGGQTILVARFLPVVRTLAPGAARLPYRRIAPYSCVAAPVWATLEAGAGYTATASLQHALTLGGPLLVGVAAAAAAAGVLCTRIRRRRNTGGHGPRPDVPLTPTDEAGADGDTSTRVRPAVAGHV